MSAIKKYSVLLVDDSKVARMTLENVITKLGHEVVAHAVDGLDGIEQYNKYNPDIVFSDIEMPNLNGYEMVLKITQANPNAKVIIVSSVVNAQIVQLAKANGAYSYQKKPINQATLEKIFTQLDS